MKTIAVIILMMMTFADQPRKVLLFYKTDGEQRLESQMQVLDKAQDGIRERDIQIERIPYAAEHAGKWKKWQVKDSEPFTFVLVGRDGGEKLRASEVVTTEKLFGLIDAMPMRRQEISDKN